MKITLSADKFKDIDLAFARLKENRKDTAAVSSIKRTLNSVFEDVDIDVSVISNLRGKFFIMSIFPDSDTIDSIIKCVVNNDDDKTIAKTWNSTSKLFIEIDSRILTDDSVHATSKELTALLLHEIGHTMYSNAIPERISKIMRLEYNRAPMNVKKLLGNKVFSDILKLPILAACLYDNYKTKDKITKELKSDFCVVKSGYGDELESVLGKMIMQSSDPKSKEIDQTDVYDTMKSITMFSLSTLGDLIDNKDDIVKKNFDKLRLSSPSEYIQREVNDLANAFTSASFSETKAIVSETYLQKLMGKILLEYSNHYEDRDDSEILCERVFSKKLKKIDPAMIAYIQITKDSMKTNDDKMMLVSYIYAKLDVVNYYLTIIDNNIPKLIVPHSSQYLIDVRDSLLKLKDEILNYKLPVVNYGVSVGGYPVGYEG